jgi:hypothetical protein
VESQLGNVGFDRHECGVSRFRRVFEHVGKVRVRREGALRSIDTTLHGLLYLPLELQLELSVERRCRHERFSIERGSVAA